MLWLRHIVDVQPTTTHASSSHPVFASTQTPIRSSISERGLTDHVESESENNPARDRMVDVLRKAVQAAKAVPAPPGGTP